MQFPVLTLQPIHLNQSFLTISDCLLHISCIHGVHYCYLQPKEAERCVQLLLLKGGGRGGGGGGGGGEGGGKKCPMHLLNNNCFLKLCRL